MTRAAVYRLLYGEDFIVQSIESVTDAVDEVHVFWTNKPWGGVSSVEYQGAEIVFPEKFDNAVDLIEGMDKVILHPFYHPTPRNQFTVMVNGHVEAHTVLLIEADQIMRNAKEAFDEFEKSGLNNACVHQVEFWKTPKYQIPQRNRPGPIFWKTPLQETGLNGAPLGPCEWLEQWADNYGFCVSEKTMYWKTLTAIAFSSVISDSRPNPDWYEKVWKAWTPDMENLEISQGNEADIPHAYPT